MENLSNKDRLRTGTVGAEKKRLRAEFIKVYKKLMGGIKMKPYSVVSSNRQLLS